MTGTGLPVTLNAHQPTKKKVAPGFSAPNPLCGLNLTPPPSRPSAVSLTGQAGGNRRPISVLIFPLACLFAFSCLCCQLSMPAQSGKSGSLMIPVCVSAFDGKKTLSKTPQLLIPPPWGGG